MRVVWEDLSRRGLRRVFGGLGEAQVIEKKKRIKSEVRRAGRAQGGRYRREKGFGESVRWMTSYLMLREDSEIRGEENEYVLRVMNKEVGSEERVIQTNGLNTNYQKGKVIDLNRMVS